MTGVPAGEELRYELKAVASEIEYDFLRDWLRLHSAAFRRPYPPRRINNLYFDTFDLSTLEENIAGVSERTKLRFRWYGDSLEPAPGTLELKCKREHLGWKIHHPVEESPYVKGGSWRQTVARLRAQLATDGKGWLDAHPMPALINRYHREYFLSADGRIRATLDGVQEVLDQHSRAFPNFKRKANTPRVIVLEVKCAKQDRELASRVIQGLPLRVSRHSKYVVGMSAILDL